MTQPVLTARAFLVRGLLVGLLAGIAAFLVAHQVGEPHVERAIALEEAGAAGGSAHSTRRQPPRTPTVTRSGTEVSRSNQRTWGLATGTLAIGVALGGLVALVSAARGRQARKADTRPVHGRRGRGRASWPWRWCRS